MLSDNIKNLRENKGITKSELARRTGLSIRILEFIEFGKSNNPTLKTLKKIAEALGVTIDELIK